MAIAIIEITRNREHKGRLHWYRDEEAVISAAAECAIESGRVRPDTFGAAIEVLADLWYGRLIVQNERDIPKIKEYLSRHSVSAATVALLDELRAKFGL